MECVVKSEVNTVVVMFAVVMGGIGEQSIARPTSCRPFCPPVKARSCTSQLTTPPSLCFWGGERGSPGWESGGVIEAGLVMDCARLERGGEILVDQILVAQTNSKNVARELRIVK